MNPFLAYLGFTAILVLTPGSTTAVVVRNTLGGGWRSGMAAATGAAVANTSHATAAALGIAVLFSRLPNAMTILTWAGAAFLAALGVRSIYNAVRHSDGGLSITSGDPATDKRPSGDNNSFRQGLAVNLLNPAIATFYLVVVPSFLPPSAPRWYFAVLAAIHVTMAFVCHMAWALGLERLRRLFHPPAARRALESATGLALIVLAMRLLFR